MPIGPLKNLPIFPQGSFKKNGLSSSLPISSIERDSLKSARTSISRAQNENGKVSTSITHPDGYGLQASVSYSHPAVVDEFLSREQLSDEQRDTLRYNNIRRMVKARIDKEKMDGGELSKPGQVVKKVGFSAGKLKRMSGVRGMRLKLRRMVIKNPETYKNLSAKDREYFLDLVHSHAQKLRTGGSFNRPIRKSMKRKVQEDWKKNAIISKQDAQDFKRMINELPH